MSSLRRGSLARERVGRRGSEALSPPGPHPSFLHLTPHLADLGNPTSAASLGLNGGEILSRQSPSPIHFPSGSVYRSPLFPAPTHTPAGGGHENFDSAPSKPKTKAQSMPTKATYGFPPPSIQGPDAPSQPDFSPS